MLLALALVFTSIANAAQLNRRPCALLGNEDESCSCVGQDTHANPVHVWGLDNHGQPVPANAIHDSAVPGEFTRLGMKTPTHQFFHGTCPKCPSFYVVPLDKPPITAAEEFYEEMYPMIVSGYGLNTSMIAEAFAELQLHHYLTIYNELFRHLEEQGVDMMEIEGGTFRFLGKLRLMRQLALAVGAGTVCEVGFNTGASSLLWLTAGAPRVISFDLGEHGYSGVAASWLHKRFPGRFHLSMGDSLASVPAFHALFPGEVCDLVFVDGGHGYEAARGDLENFAAMAHPSPPSDGGSGGGGGGTAARGGPRKTTVVLVDDTEEAPVARAWADALADGLVTARGEVSSFHVLGEFLSSISPKHEWGGGRSVEEQHHALNGMMSYGEYTR
mmetsp:Transcript_5926/g.9963  ORF Transcript_5926/g.9963 Transcript_5926/m.9963 type:complete len:386 (-) Transcript_5926:163-1320(-)